MKSENRWVPVKDISVVAITEKKVKSVLNKMTKEKFDRLSGQMCEIPISSYETLCKMIHLVYEKAIYEPTFGDMYAELCIRLSLKAKQNPFVQIIESDEEPPTEDGVVGEGDGASSSNAVFRWTNDVNASDAEIVGPFGSIEECIDAAMDADTCPEPSPRGDKELDLHSLKIQSGLFIKVMQERNNPGNFYTVFFPMAKIEEVGQQVSEIFLSYPECEKDATKQNSFKNILLNKCQNEFDKEDIYVGWKSDKDAYEKKKESLSERDRREKEEGLEFRRIKIKKQMLGNIRFIGELFKKEMLKSKIMRICIESLLKMNELENGQFADIDEEMDEEDHEAVCKLFSTIGRAIDQGKTKPYIDIYFEKIATLSNDKKLGSRPRFMYKDLIDLRRNRWVARREEETAKTLDEIKRDFERDERIAAQQSQQLHGYRGGGGGRGNNRQTRGGRGDHRDDRRDQYGSNRQRSQKERHEVKIDKDGFEEVQYNKRGSQPSTKDSFAPAPKILSRKQSQPDARNRRNQKVDVEPTQKPSPTPTPAPAPLSEDKLKNRINNIRAEFIQGQDVGELLLSMDELQTTPNAGSTIVQINLDKALDCKDDERETIFNMLATLYSNKKITSGDVKPPLGELIEFIGSFIVDSPKAMQYVGDIVADFIRVGAVDIAWLCQSTKKLEGLDDHLIPGLIELCIISVITRNGIDEARSCVSKNVSCVTDLVGSEKWNEINALLA